MKKIPLSQESTGDNLTSNSPITRAMVHTRARELALIAGRKPALVTPADYEQAKRELTGESAMDRQDAILDSIPEEKRGDPVPGSAGHQAPESPSEDEDEEGRSKTDQLVEEGVTDAGLDQMLQSAIATGKKTETSRVNQRVQIEDDAAK